jgi:hypothetical protein
MSSGPAGPEGYNNPRNNGDQSGFPPPTHNQPPAGYPSQQPPTQQFGAYQPQSPYEMPQGSWQPPTWPVAGLPTPPRRPWFKQKRFAIPAGVVALAVLGAAVSPKQDTGTASAAASAPTSYSAPTAASSSSPVAPTSTPTSAPAPAPSPKPAPAPKPAPKPVPAPKPAPAPKVAAAPEATAGQQNALDKAQAYLAMTAFSRSGLIKQLSSSYGDGFSLADATYGVNHVNADWNEQAARKAKAYLAMTSFSHSGLVNQLSSSYGDGFTLAQAEFGVRAAGL